MAVDKLATGIHIVLNPGIDQIGTRAAINSIRSTRSVCRVDMVVVFPAKNKVVGRGHLGGFLPVTVSCDEESQIRCVMVDAKAFTAE